MSTRDAFPTRGPITLTVLLLAPSLNGEHGLRRMGHFEYGRVRDRWTTLLLAERRGRRVREGERVRVSITRHYCPHPLDLDNLYAASKVPLDALRHAGILPEDDPSVVAALSCSQERVATKKECRTTITIEPL